MSSAAYGNLMWGMYSGVDELWSFSTLSREWTLLPPPADSPKGRSGHSMTAVGTDVYVFGGQGQSEERKSTRDR